MKKLLLLLLCVPLIGFGQTSEEYFDRAYDYAENGEYQLAIDNYTKAIRIDPDDATAYYNRGVAYYDLGNYEDAIADYTRAIRIDPDYADAYFNRGLSYKKLENYEDSTSIRLAIVGRPNSGKSTLINTLLGKNYVLTGDQPGVTRDAVMLNFVWKGENFTLIDTAGIRKKSKVIDKIEKLSVDAALDAVKYAQIVVLVLDCNEALSFLFSTR